MYYLVNSKSTNFTLKIYTKPGVKSVTDTP
jgi:hypothetical protein